MSFIIVINIINMHLYFNVNVLTLVSIEIYQKREYNDIYHDF